MSEQNKPMRVDKSFKKEIFDVIGTRILDGKDGIFDRKSPRRVTLAITRDTEFWPKLKKKLIISDMPNVEEKKERKK